MVGGYGGDGELRDKVGGLGLHPLPRKIGTAARILPWPLSTRNPLAGKAYRSARTLPPALTRKNRRLYSPAL